MSGRKYTLEERLEVVMHYLASDEGYPVNFSPFQRSQNPGENLGCSL